MSTTSVVRVISTSVDCDTSVLLFQQIPRKPSHAPLSVDYCNALLADISESNLDKLQRVQNTLARVVTGLRRSEHITPALKALHWLQIWARITFKIATVVYRLRERRQLPYPANELISDYAAMRTLRSSTKSLLAESSFNSNIGRRWFQYVAAKTWNNLPDDIKTSEIEFRLIS